MAIKDSSYEGSFTIPTPKGVYQAAGDTNVNVDYAYRAENIRTERGLLASSYGTSRAFPSLGAPIETLLRFYRRNKPDDPDVFVAGANGAIYTYTLGTEGWIKRADGFASNKWSHVNYESVRNGVTVDIMLLTNAKDGMIVIYGDDLSVEKKQLTIGNEYASVKFAVLGRHAERIWGTGAPGYPDSIFYSKPYNPFDWTGVADTPELGGGVMQHPSWDGDSFLAFEPFGGYLLAIKQNAVYEIRGTDPASFMITKAYGTDGPVQVNTICTDRTNVYFLADGGIGMYDGSTLSLLARDALYETMRMRMGKTEETATACMCDRVYYLAMCIKQSKEDVVTQNNTVIEFDTERGTFMVRTGIRVKDFFVLGSVVYYTQADDPYEVFRYNDPESSTHLNVPIKSFWETPWLDLGKKLMKRDFVLRFTAEADEYNFPLEITILTDRRERKKTVMLSQYRRDYRVKIQNSGIRVKLKIESSKRATGWRIYGGIQVEYSLDEV